MQNVVDVSGFSDNGLLSLYNAVRLALEKDDAVPPEKREFFVRDYPDWKQWADAIAEQLLRRGLPFDPIRW